MGDLISIIVPVYNASAYLRQCIESIRKQSKKELEIVLVNDGSTDGSAEICREYGKTDARIHIVEKENGGLVSARKAGLEAASGNYIGFVDADDYIEKNMFERLYLKIKEYDADFVHSGMITGNGKIHDYEEGLIDFTVLDRAAYISENVFRTQAVLFALWSKLFRAELVKEAYGKLPDGQSYGEDLLCLCHCLARCRTFYLLKDAFYHYRIKEESLSHLGWVDTCMEESALYGCVVSALEKNGLLEGCGSSARYHYRMRVLHAMVEDRSSGMDILEYRFPGIDALDGMKVALYGAGNVGKSFYRQFSKRGKCEITAWVDKEKWGSWNLVPIGKPGLLKDVPYDVVVLAVKSREMAEKIKEEMERDGICGSGSCMVWEEPVYIWQ